MRFGKEHHQHEEGEHKPEPKPEPKAEGEQKPEAKAEPKPDPVPSSEGFKGEKKFKLRAKDMVTVGGVTYKAGEEFELPEREALGLVGTGGAEELPGDAPGEPTKPDKK